MTLHDLGAFLLERGHPLLDPRESRRLIPWRSQAKLDAAGFEKLMKLVIPELTEIPEGLPAKMPGESFIV